MLIEFTLGNFKSFRDKTTFSMIAANLTSDDLMLDENNIIPIHPNLQLLKTAAIYGANASGKSNLGAALRFFRQFVLHSAREAATPADAGLEPFLLDRESRQQPSFFEIVFLLEGTQYRYGFEADRTQIISEWLFHVPKTKEAMLFTREAQDISVKPAFKGGKGLEIRTRPEALFLSVATLFNVALAEKISQWLFHFSVTAGINGDDFRKFTLECLRSPELRRDINSFVQSLGLDIDAVLASEPPDPQTFSLDAPMEIKQKIAEAISQIIYTAHHFGDGEEDFELFDLSQQESQGTRKLIAMAGPLRSILQHGNPMFVDELDARLHPLMTRRIIELFHSPLTNPHGAQLLFATHDTNLLDKMLLRRDQIWFAEKDRQGATHLTSLAEYRGIRNDAAFEKQYLEGRYGAIPFLGDPGRLPWEQSEVQELSTAQEPAHA